MPSFSHLFLSAGLRRRRLAATGLAALLALTAFAAPATTIAFDVPAGEARQALRQLATQARREIVFPVELVGGVKTRAVQGEMSTDAALARMLEGTGLVATQDAKTGAIAIRREVAAAKNAVSRGGGQR
jgi:hypothetical protein